MSLDELAEVACAFPGFTRTELGAMTLSELRLWHDQALRIHGRAET